MSKKPLLSESQVAKWMKLANIDKNATQNFLTENKKNNRKTLKENTMSYARNDQEMGEEMGEEMPPMGGSDDLEMGDMSVQEPEEEVGGEEGELEFDTVDDLKQVVKDAVMDALSELGLADEMGGEEDMGEEELDLGMEGGDEGGDEPAEPAEEDEKLEEGIEILTDDEVINEVLKRVIRRLV